MWKNVSNCPKKDKKDIIRICSIKARTPYIKNKNAPKTNY